jgi:hypothetical protein
VPAPRARRGGYIPAGPPTYRSMLEAYVGIVAEREGVIQR